MLNRTKEINKAWEAHYLIDKLPGPSDLTGCNYASTLIVAVFSGTCERLIGHKLDNEATPEKKKCQITPDTGSKERNITVYSHSLSQIGQITLHNSTREIMLQSPGNIPKAALLLDSLYCAGFSPGDWLLFHEIFSELHALFGTSRRTIFYGLKTVAFTRRRDPDQAGPGRPRYQYQVPSPLQMEMHYNPYHEHIHIEPYNISDSLKDTDLQNLRTYRMGLYREWIIRGHERTNHNFAVSRQLASNRLGISKRTTRSYDAQMKTIISPQFEQSVIDRSNWRTLPLECGPNRPEWLIIKRANGQTVAMPALRFLAYEQLKQGNEIMKIRRSVNIYAPANHWFEAPPVAVEFEL